MKNKNQDFLQVFNNLCLPFVDCIVIVVELFIPISVALFLSSDVFYDIAIRFFNFIKSM